MLPTGFSEVYVARAVQPVYDHTDHGGDIGLRREVDWAGDGRRSGDVHEEIHM